MTDLIEVKTADLTGLALDWAAGTADNLELELPSGFRSRTCVVWCDPFVIKLEGRPDFHDKTRRHWKPSSNWENGGPLIEKHAVSLHCPQSTDDVWAGWVITDSGEFCQAGDTALIAACRAIVAARLGDTVQVPKELVP